MRIDKYRYSILGPIELVRVNNNSVIYHDDFLRCTKQLEAKISELTQANSRLVEDNSKLRNRILSAAAIQGKVAGMISGMAITGEYSHMQTAYEMLMDLSKLEIK